MSEYRPNKTPFADIIRAMKPGDSIGIGSDKGERQSKYVNAKRVMPDAKFSVQKQADKTFRLIRVS